MLAIHYQLYSAQFYLALDMYTGGGTGEFFDKNGKSKKAYLAKDSARVQVVVLPSSGITT